MSEVYEIQDEATWNKLVDTAPGKVMVEFFVTWCPHCQREAPLLDEMAPKIEAAGIKVYRANAEVMWQKGEVYGLSETPSFILVQDGQMIAKHVGFMEPTELIAFAEQEGETRGQDYSSFDAYSDSMTR